MNREKLLIRPGWLIDIWWRELPRIACCLLAFAAAPVFADSFIRVKCHEENVGAQVFLNGRYVGDCPVDAPASSGRVTVRAERKEGANFVWLFEKQLNVIDGVPQRVEVILQRTQTEEGRRIEAERQAAEAVRQKAVAEVVERRRLAEAEAKRVLEARIPAIIQGIEDSLVLIPYKVGVFQREAPFLIGKTEVTQLQWRVLMGEYPAMLDQRFRNCDDCAITNVSWNDAKELIGKLNARTKGGFRLPTSEEWEFACRGGENHQYCGGDDLDTVGWYEKNSGDKAHSVGQKNANAFGLHDMSGNVYEWMEDRDDHGGRVMRGGAWLYPASNARLDSGVETRAADFRGFSVGIRLARARP